MKPQEGAVTKGRVWAKMRRASMRLQNEAMGDQTRERCHKMGVRKRRLQR